ncbi:hypothetical protein LIER_43367 [Lithospermum erythrorhizon]|uniref:Uncharacterized protein n=1 Tax=Lithospermum erythrorhizon TaxID=34254 RepID=A0AAV3PYJ2_LITER
MIRGAEDDDGRTSSDLLGSGGGWELARGDPILFRVGRELPGGEMDGPSDEILELGKEPRTEWKSSLGIGSWEKTEEKVKSFPHDPEEDPPLGPEVQELPPKDSVQLLPRHQGKAYDEKPK